MKNAVCGKHFKLLDAKSHRRPNTKCGMVNITLLNAKNTQKASGSKANFQKNTKNKPTQTRASKKTISFPKSSICAIEKILYVLGP